jgi:hypothetical protein
MTQKMVKAMDAALQAEMKAGLATATEEQAR